MSTNQQTRRTGPRRLIRDNLGCLMALGGLSILPVLCAVPWVILLVTPSIAQSVSPPSAPRIAAVQVEEAATSTEVALQPEAVTLTAEPNITPTQVEPSSSPTDDVEVVGVGSGLTYHPNIVLTGETAYGSLCTACHGPDARGLPNLGLNLVESEFVQSLTDDELLDFIKTGRPIWDANNTTGLDMPPRGGNPALGDQDILSIIAYVRVLSGQATMSADAQSDADSTESEAAAQAPIEEASATTTQPVIIQPTVTQAVTPEPIVTVDSEGATEDQNVATDNDPAAVANGQTIFASLCAACHGPDARGLPNLGLDLVDSEFVQSLTDDELLTFIKSGRPIWDAANITGLDMPPKGGNPALTDEEIGSIILYLRSLASAP